MEATFSRLMSLPMLRFLGGKGQWTSSSKAVLGVATLLVPIGLLGLTLNTGGFGLWSTSPWTVIVPLALQTQRRLALVQQQHLCA